MTITELLQELKERLKDRKSAFVITEDWNGDTEGGFYTTHEFDLEKLYVQMDKFGEDLRQRGVPEHLATQPQAPQGAVTREQLEAAFEAEIVKVSHVAYDSNEICRHFFNNIRTALCAAPETPEGAKP